MTGVELDTTRQRDLYQQACRDMAGRLPGWTDAFPSDPAVAILEHLTYLSDIQNYMLNQVEDAHYLAYLNLLGATRRRLTPARLQAAANPAAPCRPGRRFQVEGVPFEVTKAPPDGLPQICRVSLRTAGGVRTLERDAPLTLGEESPCGLTLTLTGPLPAGGPWTFWCAVAPHPGRNPPAKDTPPPVVLSARLRTGGRWQTIPCADGTCGFLQSGPVTVTTPEEGDAVELLADGGWEGAPRLLSVTLEPVELTQLHTRSVQVELAAPFTLPEGWRGNRRLFFFTPCGKGWRQASFRAARSGRVTGWRGEPPAVIRVVAAEPDFPALRPLAGLAMEELAVEEPGLWPDSLRVMVEENGVWYDCPVCPPEAGRTLERGCRWEPRHTAVRFGDGRDYLPPAPGQALLSGCALTLGRAANGAGGTLLDPDGARLTALAPAGGGQDDEPPRDAFVRAAREQEEPLRAVTCRDYETLARRSPGLALAQVRALPGAALGKPGPGVVVLARPVSSQPRPPLTDWQRERLEAFLEPFRLLGVSLEVRGPRYCPIRLRAVVLTSEPVPQEDLRRAILPLADGVDGPLDFGGEVSYTALYAALGSVAGVRLVRRLELTPLAEGAVRTRDGSVRPAPDMLPCLAEWTVEQTQ